MTATIKQVEVFGVKMPLVGSFTSGGKSYDVTKCVVVRITDTDGVTGISSIDPSNKSIAPNTADDIAVTIRNVLGPALIGENPDRINLIVEGAAKLTPHQPGAVAGVELACIELACRRRGIALFDYVGGAVLDRVRFNGWMVNCRPTRLLLRRSVGRMMASSRSRSRSAAVLQPTAIGSWRCAMLSVQTCNYAWMLICNAA